MLTHRNVECHINIACFPPDIVVIYTTKKVSCWFVDAWCRPPNSPFWMSFMSRWMLDIRIPTAWDRLLLSSFATWDRQSSNRLLLLIMHNTETLNLIRQNPFTLTGAQYTTSEPLYLIRQNPLTFAGRTPLPYQAEPLYLIRQTPFILSGRTPLPYRAEPLYLIGQNPFTLSCTIHIRTP